MLRNIWISLVLLALFTVLTGLIYPVVTTVVGHVIFPTKSNGSLITKGGKIVGSELIGQPFSDARYFWGRLSATVPYAYNAGSSTGSNLGPLNPQLLSQVRERITALGGFGHAIDAPLPVDLVTASGSGLDPHISPAAAYLQIPRVARARGVREEDVRSLVARYTEVRQFGFLGEERVNVLLLNLALDSAHVYGENQ